MTWCCFLQFTINCTTIIIKYVGTQQANKANPIAYIYIMLTYIGSYTYNVHHEIKLIYTLILESSMQHVILAIVILMNQI